MGSHAMAVALQRSDPPTLGEAHDSLREILAQPEFQPPGETLLDRIKEWAWDLLTSLLGRLGIEGVVGEAVQWILLATIAIGVAMVLLYIVRALLRDAAGSGRRPSSDDLTVAGPASDRARRALEEAARAADRGDFAGAMRRLYLGVIYTLDAADQLRFAERKTAGEYARELKPAELRRGWRTLVARFYPVAYGGRAATRDGWVAMRDAADTLGVPR